MSALIHMKSDLNLSTLPVSVHYSRHHSHKILEAVTSACPANRTPIQGILLLTGFRRLGWWTVWPPDGHSGLDSVIRGEQMQKSKWSRKTNMAVCSFSVSRQLMRMDTKWKWSNEVHNLRSQFSLKNCRRWAFMVNFCLISYILWDMLLAVQAVHFISELKLWIVRLFRSDRCIRYGFSIHIWKHNNII